MDIPDSNSCNLCCVDDHGRPTWKQFIPLSSSASLTLLVHGSKTLKLAMLGCETQAPYGPLQNTAQMLMRLITTAAQHKMKQSRVDDNTHTIMMVEKQQKSQDYNQAHENNCVIVSLAVYNVTEFDYPKTQQEWDSYDGFIIPGSFSSAYELHPWILKLKQVIRSELHPKQRKVLALCFGHQIYAHAFQFHNQSQAGSEDEIQPSQSQSQSQSQLHPSLHLKFEPACSPTTIVHAINSPASANTSRTEIPVNETTLNSTIVQTNVSKHGGLVIKCTAGAQAGSRPMLTTLAGYRLLLKPPQYPQLQMGTSTTHTQTQVDPAIHLLYTHNDMVYQLPSFAVSLASTCHVNIVAAAYFATAADAARFQSHLLHNSDNNNSTDHDTPSPYAFTFQGHPEYLSGDGSFQAILDLMANSKSISSDQRDTERVNVNKDVVTQHAVHVMALVASHLGWLK